MPLNNTSNKGIVSIYRYYDLKQKFMKAQLRANIDLQKAEKFEGPPVQILKAWHIVLSKFEEINTLLDNEYGKDEETSAFIIVKKYEVANSIKKVLAKLDVAQNNFDDSKTSVMNAAARERQAAAPYIDKIMESFKNAIKEVIDKEFKEIDLDNDTSSEVRRQFRDFLEDVAAANDKCFSKEGGGKSNLSIQDFFNQYQDIKIKLFDSNKSLPTRDIIKLNEFVIGFEEKAGLESLFINTKKKKIDSSPGPSSEPSSGPSS